MIYNEKEIDNEGYLFKDFNPIDRTEPVVLGFFEQLSYWYQRLLLFLDGRSTRESDSFFKNGYTHVYSNNLAKTSELEHYIRAKPIDLASYTDQGKKYSLFTNGIDAMKVRMFGLCTGAVVYLFQKIKEGRNEEDVFFEYHNGVPYESAVYQTVYMSYKPVISTDLKTFFIKFIDAYQLSNNKEQTYQSYLADYNKIDAHPRILESLKDFLDSGEKMDEDFASKMEGHILSKKLQIDYVYKGTFRSIYEHYSGRNVQSTDRLSFIFSLAGMETATLLNDASPDKVLNTSLNPGNYGLLIPCYNFWGKRANDHFVGIMIDEKGATTFYDPNFGFGKFETSTEPIKNAISNYTGLTFSDAHPEGSITFLGWLFNLLTLSSNSPFSGKISSGFSLIRIE